MRRTVPLRLAEMAGFRQAAYRLFGSALLYPDEGRFTTLAARARELELQSQPYVGLAFFPQWRRFLEALAAHVDSETTDLEGTYLGLFAVNQDVPVCESGFLTSGASALTMASLEGDYRAAGVSMTESFGEPPDHAAVELEFMGLLCSEEARAWTKRSLRDGVYRLEAEVRFLDRHLSRWFPAFAEQVVRRAGDGFYSTVAQAAHAFIEHDRELLVALLNRQGRAATHGC